jgi:peptidoglycan/xylan/chitin deacetylase (PgdA/CDA1 family)
MYCTTAFLDELIPFLRASGYDIVTMSECLARLRSPRSRRFVAITFDDGYRDNLQRALPVFVSHNAPFTIYITSDMIRRRYNYSWRCLEELVLQSESLDLSFLGRQLNLSTRNAKYAAFFLLEAACKNIPQARDELNDWFRRAGINADRLLDAEALDEHDLRTLTRSHLVEIGGHSETHPSLAALPAEGAEAEMADNKVYLEALTDRPLQHFAYPFGDRSACGRREFELTQRLGFATAVTTRYGNLFPEHAATPTALPRHVVSGDRLDRAELRFRLSGAGHLVRHGFSSPVITE